MAKIYLFQEHYNFQAGKSPIDKRAVIQFHGAWIIFCLIPALVLLAVGGNSLRLQWRYDATGAQTIGTVTECNETGGNRNLNRSSVAYSYSVQGVSYTGQDSIGGWVCDNYPNAVGYTVYYLKDAPEESGISAFLHQNDWDESYLFGTFGIGLMLFVFFLLVKNRHERYKYALLEKQADTLIYASIEKVGEVTGKDGYKYADYVFTTPDNERIKGQIRSGRGYEWPLYIKEGDSLYILYLDKKNYCVL